MTPSLTAFTLQGFLRCQASAFVGFLNFNRDKTARYVYAHPADIVTFQLNIAFYLICIEIVFHTPTEIPLSPSNDSRYVLLISSVPEIFTDQIKFERKIQRIIPHTAPAKSPVLFL